MCAVTAYVVHPDLSLSPSNTGKTYGTLPDGCFAAELIVVVLQSPKQHLLQKLCVLWTLPCNTSSLHRVRSKWAAGACHCCGYLVVSFVCVVS